VPTCWRALAEIAAGGQRVAARIDGAVHAARRAAWAGIEARHGAIPGIVVADKTLAGVTGLRLDATVVPCHSDKEGAEPNFKGFGLHPLGCWCDNTGEPLAGMLRPGSAGSNTAADHIKVLGEAVAALASRPGHQLIYSAGWALGQREKNAITAVPPQAWQIAVDHRGEVRERRAEDACADTGCAHRKCWVEEAHVTELTALLRQGRAGDSLAGWPATMRVFARRERPHPGAQLTLFEAEDGWRYSLWVTNLPKHASGWRGQPACIDAAHTVHARVEDAIRTGKDTGIGKFPSRGLSLNRAWFTAALTAAALLSWLRLLALDGDLAKTEPKTLRYRILHAAGRLAHSGRRRRLKISATWPWAPAIVTAWDRIAALPHPP